MPLLSQLSVSLWFSFDLALTDKFDVIFNINFATKEFINSSAFGSKTLRTNVPNTQLRAGKDK